MCIAKVFLTFSIAWVKTYILGLCGKFILC